LILNAIGKEIIEKTWFHQLERNSLLLILREQKLASVNNHQISNLKTAYFFLLFSVEKDTSLFNYWHKTISIRLTNDQGVVLYSENTSISSLKKVDEQIPALVNNLILQLIQIQEKRKLRGKIIDIIPDPENVVKINIGEECGVRFGQKYFIVEKPNIILDVYKTSINESLLKTSDLDVIIQKNKTQIIIIIIDLISKPILF